MYLNKKLIKNNRVSIAIFIFLALFSIVHYLKPSLLYTKEGGFRNFGLGYRNKTVIPIWLVAIILGIL